MTTRSTSRASGVAAIAAIAAIATIVAGVAIGVAGIHVGETDDAPGAALIGLVLMVAAIWFAVRKWRRRA